MRTLRAGALTAGALLAAACASVAVTPAGSGLAAKPKSPDCAIEFFRTKPPDRPYDELAGLHATASYSGAAALQDEMRAQACELGADAVIVNRDFIPSTPSTRALMSGTAVKYR